MTGEPRPDPDFGAGTAAGFHSPTAVPRDEREAQEWQEANRRWWERLPMRYDWGEANRFDEMSMEWFAQIDRTFFSRAATFLDSAETPFRSLIPFDTLHDKTVLEIGVGMGSHAALLARAAGRFIGIDLTDYAVTATTRRFELFDLRGEILRMDAERMDLPTGCVDFVWSWGVIHHSADTGRVLREIHRVLRPGGRAVVMVYHRSPWNYYVMQPLRGAIRGDLARNRSIHGTVQAGGDGALARYYTTNEFSGLAGDCGFVVNQIGVYGDKSEMIPLPHGRAKERVDRLIPNGLSRLFLGRLRAGMYLVADLRPA